VPWTPPPLAQPLPQGFLERCCEIRWAVPTPTPNSLEIARQDAPEARSVSNRVWLTNMGGYPSRFPFARALRKPALTRSASGKTAARHVREFMPEVLRELGTQSQNRGLVGMTTGIHSVDLATGGIRPGELWTIGALPGEITEDQFLRTNC
jgi:hypothetical protein